jgi:uncharacterized protein
MKKLALAVALYVAASAAGGALVVNRAMRRPRAPAAPFDRMGAERLAGSVNASLDAVWIRAADGARLDGWRFTPRRPVRDSVLLLHAIRGNRAEMLSMARIFLEHGYRALAVDARAHGQSDGALITFGALEAEDAARWIAWMRRDTGGCVVAFGASLGAAYALQSANAPGVCAVVAQSGFASYREIAFDRVGQQLGTGPWVGRTLLRPGIELGMLYARVRYGADLAGASALPVVRAAGAPILVIHGTDDDNVPVRHAQMVHAANPARVSLWLVQGGSHGAAGRVAAAEYQSRIFGFLAAHTTR